MAGPSHPLYLTDSIVGGGSYSDFQGETVYAGGVDAHGAKGGTARVRAGCRGALRPCRTANCCRPALHLPAGTADAPFLLQWTPGPDTPDLLFYQCTTHMKLGWEIRVLDAAPAA